MKFNPKQQKAFEALGELSENMSDSILKLVAKISQSRFEEINKKYDLDAGVRDNLSEILAFASMNATIQTLVVLVEILLETFGDSPPDQKDLIKMGKEIAFTVNQRLSKVFTDLVEIDPRNEELN